MDEVPQGISNNLTALFVTAIVALAGVVGVLFRLVMKRDTAKDKRITAGDTALANERKDIAVERKDFEVKLERLRAEFEVKNRELAEEYAQDLRKLYEDNRTHEDAARKEFAEILENVSTKAGESSQSIVNMLDKFYERFVGPRARY